jgi:hypothetical protein
MSGVLCSGMKLDSPPAADAKEGSMTSSCSTSLIFRVPFLDHLTRFGLVPNVLNLEQTGDGMEKILSIVIIDGGVLRAECASRVVGNSLSTTDGLLLLNVSLRVSGQESQSLGQKSVK